MNESNGKPRPRVIPVGDEPPLMDDGTPPTSRPQPNHPHPGKPKGKPDATNANEKAKAKTGERFAILNACIDFALANLTRAEIAVWLILFRDTRDGTARTSYDDLARRAGLDRRNVGRALRRLEAKGLVEVVRRGGIRQGASHYRVHGLPKGG